MMCTKALGTITVDILDRLLKLHVVRFFVDASIARFSGLKSQLGTNSNIVESNDFETGVSKIQLHIHS